MAAQLLITYPELFLYSVLTEDMLVNVDEDRANASIAAASARVANFLRPHYTLPLLAWDEDVKKWTADLAAWDLLQKRGVNPEAGADLMIKERYAETIAELKLVAGGLSTASVTDSSPGSTVGDSEAGDPDIIQSEQRGWSRRGTTVGRSGFTGD